MYSPTFKTRAVIHSLSKGNEDKAVLDDVMIIHENGNNDVVAEYKGIRYTAIFNVFVCLYYLDDIYGKLRDQNKCPHCGAALVEKEETDEQTQNNSC
jgi:hypothetical protein